MSRKRSRKRNRKSARKATSNTQGFERRNHPASLGKRQAKRQNNDCDCCVCSVPEGVHESVENAISHLVSEVVERGQIPEQAADYAVAELTTGHVFSHGPDATTTLPEMLCEHLFEIPKAVTYFANIRGCALHRQMQFITVDFSSFIETYDTDDITIITAEVPYTVGEWGDVQIKGTVELGLLPMPDDEQVETASPGDAIFYFSELMGAIATIIDSFDC